MDNPTNSISQPPVPNAMPLPPKPDKLETIKIVQDIYKGNATLFCLLDFERFRQSNKTRSDAYRGFMFLCYANTTHEAGWLVCRYAEKGRCTLSSAIRPFKSRTGGTSTLKQHTEDHERSDKRNVLGFTFEVQKVDKSRVVQAGAKSVILSNLPLNFAEPPVIAEFAKAVFQAGQGCASGTNVDIQDLMPSRPALRDAVQVCAEKERVKFVKSELKDVLHSGGGLTCDARKQKINGVKFYDLVLHYVSPGIEHPKDGYTNIRLVSKVLLLQEHRGGESGIEIKEALESGMKARYGISFQHLTDSGFTFVTDCASNMPRIVKMSSSNNKIPFNQNWMGCVCHQLNTVMKHAIDEDTNGNGVVSNNVVTVEKIVNFFKSSNLNKCQPEGYKLIQDVETRFGTTHDVVVRFLKASARIGELVTDGSSSAVKGYMEDLLQDEKDEDCSFAALQAVVSSFGPLREIETRLEASSTPTMHLVLPMLEHAKRNLRSLADGRAYGPMLSLLHPVEISFSKLVLNKVEKIEIHPLWVVGCLLHPRLRVLSMVWDASRREEYSTKSKKLQRTMLSVLSGEDSVEVVANDDTARAERRNRILNSSSGMVEFNIEEHLDMVSNGEVQLKSELSRYEDHSFTREQCSLSLQKDFGIIRFCLS